MPEIEHLHAAFTAVGRTEKQIAGLQVAVDDAQPVGHGNGFASLDHVVDRVIDGQRTGALYQLTEVAPVQVFHDDIGRSARQTVDVQHAHDVFVADLDSGPSFPHEPGDRLGTEGHVGKEHLDGDRLVELDVPSGQDEAHPTQAEETFDGVFSSHNVPNLRHPFRDLGGPRRLGQVAHGPDCQP